MPFRIGEVRPAWDADFESFVNLFNETEGWNEKYHKHQIVLHTKVTEYDNVKMMRLVMPIPDSAHTVYDTLHDAEYRKVWDKNIINGYEIARVNETSDIGYYSMKSPLAFKNRDFVTQRVWRVNEAQTEFILFNHSVFHKAEPKKPNFVRGMSYITGYMVRADPKHPTTHSILYYITQTNPGGKIPAWAVNKAAKFIAPTVARRLRKVASRYPAWKAKNRPDYKPWWNPSQSTTPMINMADVLDNPDFNINDKVDENPQDVDISDDDDLEEGVEVGEELTDETFGANGAAIAAKPSNLIKK